MTVPAGNDTHAAEMTGYVIRRVIWGILLLVIVCALTFILFRVLPDRQPGGAAGWPRPAAETDQRNRTRRCGWTSSLPTQFWDYVKNILLHFNFGYSYYSQESVLHLIKERLPATISLTVGAAVLWIVFGLGVGILSAVQQRTRSRTAARWAGRCCSSRRPNSGWAAGAAACSPATSGSSRSSPAPAATSASPTTRGNGSPR